MNIHLYYFYLRKLERAAGVNFLQSAENAITEVNKARTEYNLLKTQSAKERLEAAEAKVSESALALLDAQRKAVRLSKLSNEIELVAQLYGYGYAQVVTDELHGGYPRS